MYSKSKTNKNQLLIRFCQTLILKSIFWTNYKERLVVYTFFKAKTIRDSLFLLYFLNQINYLMFSLWLGTGEIVGIGIGISIATVLGSAVLLLLAVQVYRFNMV